MSNIDWDDVWSSFIGFYYFAQTYVYPGFTAEQVVVSVKDGSIFIHLMNICMVWFMMRFKRQTPTIRYVTEDK